MRESDKPYVSIYLRNSKRGPSDYYRVYQYVPYLDATCVIHDAVTEEEFITNLNMKVSIKKKLYQGMLLLKIYVRRMVSMIQDIKNMSDIIIVQREVIPHVMGVFAGMLLNGLCRNRILIWDYDDDIFLNNEVSQRERKILEQNADCILVTSSYLGNLLSQSVEKKIKILPTTDGFYKKYSSRDVRKRRIESYGTELRLVWVGTQSNINNVVRIIQHLEHAAKKLREKNGKTIILTIVCNVGIHIETVFLKINNIVWSRESAEKAILDAHVGIMPLENTKYALGKGGFKLIQYMSTGLPVLASDVGFNNEIVVGGMGKLISTDQEENWESEVFELGVDIQKWMDWGYQAAERYMTRYSIDANIEIWKGLVKINDARWEKI